MNNFEEPEIKFYNFEEIDELIQEFKKKFNNDYSFILERLEKLKINISLNPKFKINNDPDYGIKSWIDALYTTNKAIEEINLINIKIDIMNKRIKLIISKILNEIDDDNYDKYIDNNIISIYKNRNDLRTKVKIIENNYIGNDAGYKCIYEWRNDCIQFLIEAINK